MIRALILIVVLAPLPFGSNRPWAWALLAILVGGLMILWAWRRWQAGIPLAVTISRILGPGLLFLVVCVYVALQAVPGMPSWLANPFWQLPPETLSDSALSSISVDPARTVTGLMRLLTYGGFFWLCLQSVHSPRRAGRLLSAIAIAAAIYGSYGLLMQMSGARLILWYPKWDHVDSVTGTFPNRNHFATFIGLGLLCALAWLAGQLEAAGTPKRWIAKLLHAPRTRDFAMLAAVPICLAAVVLSLSRAGLASTLLASMVFLTGLLIRSGSRGLWAGFAVAFLAVAGIYVGLGVGGTFDRIALLLDPEVSDVRFPAYRQILCAIADNPWLGVGYGAFEDAFKAYRAPPLEAYFDVAHSTYLENALELGLPAAIALWLSIGWLALACLHGFLRRRPGWLYGWTAACATLLVGSHAALDFSLQIPAVAIAYAAILATGCSQNWSGASHRTRVRHRVGSGEPDLGYFDKAT